jgi:hypothetical protein
MKKVTQKVTHILDKAVRVVTIAPVMALILMLSLYFLAPRAGITAEQLLFGILFLSVMPVVAYPIQPIVPGFRDKGRKGQRDLAIITAVLGYIGGIVYCFASRATETMFVIYLTYLLSGTMIALFSRFTKLKASGHACGIAGPIAAATHFISPWALLGLVLYVVVLFSSLRMKRHTLPEFLVGGAISVAAMFISIRVAELV